MSGPTNLEVTTIESAVRIDHQQSKLPTEKVGLVGLYSLISCVLWRLWDITFLHTSTRTHFSDDTCLRSPMMRCLAAADEGLSVDMIDGLRLVGVEVKAWPWRCRRQRRVFIVDDSFGDGTECSYCWRVSRFGLVRVVSVVEAAGSGLTRGDS